MELRQLKYFQLVCQLGSITNAAEQAHIAQPAMSIAIQKLEEELGVQLLDRSQKKIKVTSAGCVFLKRVGDILTRVENSVLEMKDYGSFHRENLRIGIPPMLGAMLFPYIFSKFQKEHPYLYITVIEEGSLTIAGMLEKGELDIGIIIISNLSPQLDTISITTSEVFVCLPIGHPLTQLSRIPLQELRGEQFLLFKEDTFSHQLVVEECTKNQFSPRIVVSSSQIETIIGLVEQGVGITFLLEPIARKHSNVASLSLANSLSVTAGLAWNKNRYLSNATQAFISAIQNFSVQFTGEKTDTSQKNI
ncbi:MULTISPECIES: LysR family transcriptional regulator [Sporomusa]|uniref:LysR family transcriptional regulator n=1 Tax=Sporomusa TaxID=2375 RepID=UPI0031582C96